MLEKIRFLIRNAANYPTQTHTVIFLVFYTGISSLVFAYEYTFIEQSSLKLYLTLKIVAIYGAVPPLLMLIKRPGNQFLIGVVGAIVSLYSIGGELFSDLYVYAMIQVALGYIMLLKPNHTSLIVPGGICPAIMMYILYLKEKGVIHSQREPIEMDYLSIALIFATVFFLINASFGKKHRKELEFMERFSLVGENTNIFAHNLKSILSSLFLFTSTLKSTEDKEEIRNLINSHEDDLKGVLKYMNDFNLLARSETVDMSFKDILMQTTSILKISDSQIALTGEDFRCNCSKQDVQAILINVLSNAKKINVQKIDIKTTSNDATIVLPFSHSYPKSSGVGLSMARKLANRNHLKLEARRKGDLYIVRLYKK